MKRFFASVIFPATLIAGIIAVCAVKQEVVNVSLQHCIIENCHASLVPQLPTIQSLPGDGCTIVICETSQIEGTFDGSRFFMAIQLDNCMTEGHAFPILPVSVQPSPFIDGQSEIPSDLLKNRFVAYRGGPRSSTIASGGSRPGKIQVLEVSKKVMKVEVDVDLIWGSGERETIKKCYVLQRLTRSVEELEVPCKESYFHTYKLGSYELLSIEQSTFKNN